MNIETVIVKLEQLFAEHKNNEVEEFLITKLEEATREGDDGSRVTILNELIGFHRDRGEYEQSITYCEQVLDILNKMELQGTVPYATTVLNIGNALRAAGKLEQSLEFHQKAYSIYQEQLEENDERIASLHNNISLLYQEMGKYEEAVNSLKQALAIIEKQEDKIKCAITYSNLGASLLNLGEIKEAKKYLNYAMHIFEEDEEKDFHYGACVAANAQAYFMENQYKKSYEYYEIALKEQEKHCGKSDFYYRIRENMRIVEERRKTEVKGLQLCKDYFFEVALPVFKHQYPELIEKAAFGLIGEGSECLGFDDEESRDHDFGPGFCIWLSGKDYPKFEKKAKEIYEQLPKEYRGFKRNIVNGAHRIGMINMEEFFTYYTGTKSSKEYCDIYAGKSSQIDYLSLCAFFSGEIFLDESRCFTNNWESYLSLFENELEDFWIYGQIRCLREMAQCGQYNYQRMKKREDALTVQISWNRFVESALRYIHMRNKKFPPYYKWLRRSAQQCEKLQVIVALLERQTQDSSEEIADVIVEDLRGQLAYDFSEIPETEKFLEIYANVMLEDLQSGNENLVKEIIALEWEAFDLVKNEGGRASCQEDFKTFEIMRRSQYNNWPKRLLCSYLKDFKEAKVKGRNLITEKYGRMMESTDSKRYKELSKHFPEYPDEHYKIVEQVVEIQVQWMESLAKEYPYLAANSRKIRSITDTIYETSYETYLRGELLTYSPQTLKLYGRFIVELINKNQNLTKLNLEQTSYLYGYASLQKAEDEIKNKKCLI